MKKYTIVLIISLMSIFVNAQVPSYVLDGQIYKNDTLSAWVEDGVVNLYKYDTTLKVFPLVSTVSISGDWYHFGQVDSGQYIMLAKPGPIASAQGYVSTYYYNYYGWDRAEIIHHDHDTGNLDFGLIRKPNLNGSGVIKGVMRESNKGFGKIQGPGDPLGGVDVSLIDKSTSTPVAFDQTHLASGNDTGVFFFSGLDTGYYYIYCDIAGIKGDTNWLVHITSANDTISNIVIYADSSEFLYDTISDNSTNVSLILNAQNNILSVFPNPFYEFIEISYLLPKSGNVEMEISDISGKRTNHIIRENQNIGEHQYMMPVKAAQYTSGVYILTLKLDGELLGVQKVRKL